MTVEIEPITGRYATFNIGGTPHRIYWEEAGSGPALLCLHTAGADGRQYRALLNNPTITEHFRVICFDMPWHGKSSPPAGFAFRSYELDTESYIAMILGFADGLALDRPVVMGCSIGGRAVLHLAARHPERFRAFIGLQSSTSVPALFDTDWLDHPNVQGAELAAAIVMGMMAPQSPRDHVHETLWHYMQGGPGVFRGDINFYKVEGNVTDEHLTAIRANGASVYLLTGEYDYSARPVDTRYVADRIGIDMTTMEQLGHFPMSENPDRFFDYLMPVLNDIREGME